MRPSYIRPIIDREFTSTASQAHTPVMVWGPPGVGKSQIIVLDTSGSISNDELKLVKGRGKVPWGERVQLNKGPHLPRIEHSRLAERRVLFLPIFLESITAR